MADLKAKKAAKGYTTSDPSGVLLRKIKRKDVTVKSDVGVRSSEMEIDNVEVAVDGGLVEQSESPKHKRARTGKGGNTVRALVKGEKNVGNVGGIVGNASLNAQVGDSFWHVDFDFRKYGLFVDNSF